MEQSSNYQLSGIVVSLERRVEQLLEEHTNLLVSYDTMRRENEELKSQCRGHEERIQALQKELATADLIGAMGRGADPTRDARAQAYINRLMREVDACIKLLSSIEVEKEE